MSLSITGGVLPALLTPMDAEGVFVPAMMEKLCGSLYAAGVDGLYVCGQTGEGLQQPVAQR
ncbi:MAG: dihydrodipicolinate synthase family protein, partial [Bryobacterales bacterium]|nr:dihydrodipicolinate synthase family protein [Bryobacterales bacterium]